MTDEIQPPEGTVEIDVDGLPAHVDEGDYTLDPERVIEGVRTARAEAADLTDIHKPADWDYDSLVLAFGEDDESEVS